MAARKRVVFRVAPFLLLLVLAFDWLLPNTSSSRTSSCSRSDASIPVKSLWPLAQAFSIQSKFLLRRPPDGCARRGSTRSFSHSPKRKSAHWMQMRDTSASYWFQVGDRVRVVEDVLKAGVNLRGRCGRVLETREKCTVDPTCCCAEQVDTGMAVRVELEAAVTNTSSSDESTSLQHYFAEDELVKVVEKSETAAEQVPFDGMSCVAFKLEQLKSSSQPRGLAFYDPTQPTSSTKNDP